MLGTFRLQAKWTSEVLKQVGAVLRDSQVSEMGRSVLIFQLLSGMDLEYEVAQARFTAFFWYIE